MKKLFSDLDGCLRATGTSKAVEDQDPPQARQRPEVVYDASGVGQIRAILRMTMNSAIYSLKEFQL